MGATALSAADLSDRIPFASLNEGPNPPEKSTQFHIGWRSLAVIMGDDQPRADGTQQPDEWGPGVTDDDLYRALSATRRRRLLYLLAREADQAASVGELATLLAGWDATEANQLVTAQDRRQIIVDLHHRHVPLLEDAGLVTYDDTEGMLRLTDLDDRVRDLIVDSVDTNPTATR